jgi:hypothetical protein
LSFFSHFFRELILSQCSFYGPCLYSDLSNIALKSKDMKILSGLTFFLLFSSISFAQLDYAKILGDTSKSTEKPFSIALHGGIGLRTGVFLDGEREFNKDFARRLNYGYHVEFQTSYFLKPNWGVGLVANLYGAQSSGNYEMANDVNSDVVINKTTQTDRLIFIGPALVGRYNYKKFNLQYSFAVGVQSYMSEMKWDEMSTAKSFKSEFNGFTWSLGGNIQIGYQVMENINVFICPTYYFGLLNKGDFTGPDNKKTEITLKNEDRIDVSRFSIGLGASYSF